MHSGKGSMTAGTLGTVGCSGLLTLLTLEDLSLLSKSQCDASAHQAGESRSQETLQGAGMGRVQGTDRVDEPQAAHGVSERAGQSNPSCSKGSIPAQNLGGSICQCKNGKDSASAVCWSL